jgi:hypothetical protein
MHLRTIEKKKYVSVSRQNFKEYNLRTTPAQRVVGALFLEVKWLGHEADQSIPSGTKVKNKWSYSSTPPSVFTVWCLIKHRENFTFYSFMWLEFQ